MVVLVRYGEVAVKGVRTRRKMERLLARNIADAVRSCGLRRIAVAGGRVFVYVDDENCAAREVSNVFGVKSLSIASETDFDTLDHLANLVAELYGDRVRGRRFAVRVRRVGRHEFTSIDAARAIGARLVEAGGSVDLENPDVEVFVEIRGRRAYIYDRVMLGVGGLPLGSEGRILALVSGGIDSPVAAWMVMRRGAEPVFAFVSVAHPFDTVQALRTIRALGRYIHGVRPKVVVVRLGETVPAIRRLRIELWNAAFKRALYLAAARLAEEVGAEAVVTGEVLGQVSTQTLSMLNALQTGIDIPFLRPLIGMDKDDIVSLARRIGTYEESAKAEEFCAIFSPKPRTWLTRAEVAEIDRAIRGALESDLEGGRMELGWDELGGAIERWSREPPIVDHVPEGAIVVDLRSGDEPWRIPGSVRASLEELDRLVEPGKTYVFYCRTGLTSMVAASIAEKKGARAYVLPPDKARELAKKLGASKPAN